MKKGRVNYSLLLSIISLIGVGYLLIKGREGKGNGYKVGYVQTKLLMEKYDGVKDAQSEYDRRTKEEVSKLHLIIDDYQKHARKYEEKKSTLSPSQIQSKLQELKLMEQEIAKKQEENKKMYDAVYAETVSKVYLRVTDYIVKYGKDNNYDFVLGSNIVAGDVLYGSEKHDITNQILNDLNSEYKEQKK